MSYVTKSTRVFGQILGLFVGSGFDTPVAATLKGHPHLGFYC